MGWGDNKQLNRRVVGETAMCMSCSMSTERGSNCCNIRTWGLRYNMRTGGGIIQPKYDSKSLYKYEQRSWLKEENNGWNKETVNGECGLCPVPLRQTQFVIRIWPACCIIAITIFISILTPKMYSYRDNLFYTFCFLIPFYEYYLSKHYLYMFSLLHFTKGKEITSDLH